MNYITEILHQINNSATSRLIETYNSIFSTYLFYFTLINIIRIIYHLKRKKS